MAHALGCAAPLLSGDFILSSCDSLTDSDDVATLFARHHETGSDVTLSVMDVEPGVVSRSAAIEIRGGWVRRIIEKPAPGEAPSTTISLPLYVCTSPVLDLLDEVGPSPRGEYDLADVFQSLIDRGGRVGHQVAHHRLQVSTSDDLLALNLRCLEQDPERRQGGPESLGADSQLVPPVVIGSGVRIGTGCRIGPRVYLEGPCVMGDGVRLRDSVVLRNATIDPGSRLSGELVCAELPDPAEGEGGGM
jgi:NDP-sugar pyrophosphorylase family protein